MNTPRERKLTCPRDRPVIPADSRSHGSRVAARDPHPCHRHRGRAVSARPDRPRGGGDRLRGRLVRPLRTGAARVLGVAIAVLALAATVVVLITNGDHVVQALVILAGAGAGASGGTRRLQRSRARLPTPDRQAHPVLFFNPKSGGGKAEKFKLAEEARARGIEPIELTLGTDLEQLVRDAVADGADGLAMAGGDGSQAVVAAIAAELDLPYACIPAGTRNHFALDLGVDRDDVVGALDSFVDGGERRVDLAEVNGRVFVNNVSLGLYAEAVQQEGYRDAKLRTILDTLPEALGPEGEGLDLRWRGRVATNTPRAPRSWSPTTATGWAVPSAREPARESTTACSGSRLPPRRPGAANVGACPSDPGASGRPPSSRSTQTARSPPGSTVRR